MLVKGIVPRGYCKGVVRAIEIAKKQAHQTAPVYILGTIPFTNIFYHLKDDYNIFSNISLFSLEIGFNSFSISSKSMSFK